MSRGADIVVRSLSAAGVTKIFTLSGNQIMPIYDACNDVNIDLIHVRHEAAAVYMAEAWAQLTGETGIAMIAAAPALANSLCPLYCAKSSETPVLLITGDAPITQDGMGAFQQLDQIALTSPLTKLSTRTTKTENIADDIARSIRTAQSDCPGPVHLALPSDLIESEVNKIEPLDINSFLPQIKPPRDIVIEQILNALSAAEKPLILTGPALSQSRTGTLHEKLHKHLNNVPVITMESPRGLNDPSLGSFSNVFAQADVIVSLGKKIDFSMNFAKIPAVNSHCRFYIIDSDADSLSRSSALLGKRLALSENASPMTSVMALLDANIERLSSHDEWNNHVRQATAARNDNIDHNLEPIHPGVVCQVVQRIINDAEDPILICDGGEFGQWAQGYISSPTRIINGISGAIGGGLCFAIAAKLNRPQSTVIALMGDGTVGFHLAEFETALRVTAPFIAVIGHDSRWNAEYQIQLRNYGQDRLIGCELLPTRYDLAVQGLGGHGEFVSHPCELEAALNRAINSGLPACINVQITGLPAPGGHA